MDLGNQVGAKLGGKIEPRQAKTGQDKGRQGKRRERKRKARDCKGKVWKSVDADFFRPGGVARPLGGDLRWKSHPDLIGCLIVCFVVVLFVFLIHCL